MVTRREVLFGLAGTAFAFDGTWREHLTVEAYIFQQYAQRQGKTLGDVLPEVIPMARRAGFHNIELNAEFLSPELQATTLQLVRTAGLRMPSVYSGGPLHDDRAEATIAKALAIGKLCQPFGCQAVVTNADPKGEAVRKTDQELARQAAAMDRMGQMLAAEKLQLRIHNHTPEMLDDAREWRYTLRHTNPQFATLCLDLDWVYQGDHDPVALLREAGRRVTEIHVRSAHQKLWSESLGPGDVDYQSVAAFLKKENLEPLIAVELAYRKQTAVTHSLAEDLNVSRQYAEQVFAVR